MLILILTGLNTFFLLGILFWAFNKNCSACHQEMPFKRIFTLKDKCEKCEDSAEQKSWWHFAKGQGGKE